MDSKKKTVINGLPDGHTDKYSKVDPENKFKDSYFEFEIKLHSGMEIVFVQAPLGGESSVQIMDQLIAGGGNKLLPRSVAAH